MWYLQEVGTVPDCHGYGQHPKVGHKTEPEFTLVTGNNYRLGHNSVRLLIKPVPRARHPNI